MLHFWMPQVNLSSSSPRTSMLPNVPLTQPNRAGNYTKGLLWRLEKAAHNKVMILSEGIWGLLNCLNRARSKERPAPGVIREEAFSRTRRSSYFASLAQLYDTSALLSLLGTFGLLSCRFFRYKRELVSRDA